MRRDLVGLYSESEINELSRVLGKQGKEARLALSHVEKISINIDDAKKLVVIMKKRYAQQVVDAYPQILNFHPHCQGALLSLVINRGTSFTKPDEESRREMKLIQADLNGDNVAMIPSRLRSMKRLWTTPDLRGVAIRREEEADFFERGIACGCWENI